MFILDSRTLFETNQYCKQENFRVGIMFTIFAIILISSVKIENCAPLLPLNVKIKPMTLGRGLPTLSFKLSPSISSCSHVNSIWENSYMMPLSSI